MEGKIQTNSIPKIKKDRLMDRARNLSKIRNIISKSNNKGCQKEVDVKDDTEAAEDSVAEIPKWKEQTEDKNKLKLNPHATLYVPSKIRNNEEMYGLLINMIQQQAAPKLR